MEGGKSRIVNGAGQRARSSFPWSVRMDDSRDAPHVEPREAVHHVNAWMMLDHWRAHGSSVTKGEGDRDDFFGGCARLLLLYKLVAAPGVVLVVFFPRPPLAFAPDVQYLGLICGGTDGHSHRR